MNVRHGSEFSAAEFGSFDDVLDHHFTHPAISRPVPGKLFLREALRLTGAEISVNRLPAGVAVPFMHRHERNEEVYLVLGGEGEFQVNDEVFAIGPGSVIRVDPAAARCWRATGSQPLDYLVIQVPAGGYAGQGSIEDGRLLEQRSRWAA